MSLALNNARAADGRLKTQLVLADQAMISAANFAIGVLLARYLGPAAYGAFVLSYNIVLFIGGLHGALVFSPMMVLGAARSGLAAQEYFSAVLVYELVLCLTFVLMMIVGVAGANMLAPQWGLNSLLAPLAFAAGNSHFQEFWRRYLFVQDFPASALFNDFITYGLRCALLAGFGVAIGLNTNSALWIIGASCVAGFLTSVPAFARRWPMVPGRAGLLSVAREHWVFGKWLVAEILVYWCSGQLVIYVSAQLISVSAVGAMTAAQSIVAATHVLLMALENFVPSRAANMYVQHGEAGLIRYMRRVTLLGGACVLGIVAVGSVWAEFWLQLFFGQAYRGNGWIVPWWGGFYLLSFLQRPFSVGLRVLGHTKGMFLATASSAVVAMTVSYPLIKNWGLHGSMLALCLVQGTAVAVVALSFRKTLRSRRTAAA